MNKFTFSGFFICACTPHSKDNEYHTLSCGEIGIIHGWDIFKGSHRLIPMGIPNFETSPYKKTTGIMLRLARALWITGKAVVMDRIFCVLKGLLEMRKRGVCVNASIKKIRYWPWGVHGDGINKYFSAKILVMWDVNGMR